MPPRLLNFVKHVFQTPITTLLRYLVIVLLVLLFAIAVYAQEDDSLLVSSSDSVIQSYPLDTVAYSPDGRLVVSGGRDNIAHIYDTRTSEQQGMLVGHASWIARIAFSPNGDRVATGGHDGTVRLWNPNNYGELQRLTHHTGTVTGVAFSPDGILLASGGTDGTIWIGEAASGAEIATLINYSGPVWNVAFSPDSGSLVSGSEDGTIWWWGLYDSSVTKLEGHKGPVTALVFSPDRSYLASSSWDGTIRIWDTISGQTLQILNGHQGPVTGVVFDNESRQLISTSLDSTVRIWDAQTGTQKAVLQGAAPLSGLSYDRQNGQVISAGIDGTLQIWDVEGRIETLIQSQPTRPPPTAVLVQIPTIIPPTFVAPVRQVPVATAEQLAIAQAPPVASSGGTTLSMPTINTFAGITTFPLDGTSWAIDPWEGNAGHFQGTSWIDTPGNIVLGGHSEYPDGSRGIFNGLYALNIGDPIIMMVNGAERRFIVSEKFTVHYRDLSVVYPTSYSRLTLITCDIPTYNASTGNYDQRYVVVAVPG
jgi:WD40 repeat protein